jgi:hypothetical protein
MSASMTVGCVVAALAVISASRALHGALIARRSSTWKLAVTVTGLGLGVGPALEGRAVGYVLVAAGGLASASLAAELVPAARRPTVRRRATRLLTERRVVEAGGLTELDQAAVHLRRLRTDQTRLDAAAASGDVRGQRVAAAELATTACRLRDALEVVVRERDLVGRTW